MLLLFWVCNILCNILKPDSMLISHIITLQRKSSRCSRSHSLFEQQFDCDCNAAVIFEFIHFRAPNVNSYFFVTVIKSN